MGRQRNCQIYYKQLQYGSYVKVKIHCLCSGAQNKFTSGAVAKRIGVKLSEVETLRFRGSVD